MSVRIMSDVFESKTLGPTERLVMLALADHSDDAGRCYPSNARLCERTGLSERAVRNNIRALEQSGHLTVLIGVGQGGANVYHVHPEGGHQMPPAPNAPGTKCRQGGHEVPEDGARNAPKPSRTIKEPSNSNEAREVADLLEIHASPSAVASFMAYRRKSKGKALTLTAAKRLANNLRVIAERGGDPDDALGMAEERVWLTVEPEWYFKAKGNSNGNRQDFAANPSGVHPDPALRAIFAAAGAFKA